MTPAEQRFWKRVVRRGDDECWPWTGGHGHGYGRFNIESRKQVAAHRFAYELLIGPIPDGLTIDHLCLNPSCVNPAHMEPVTMTENIRRGTSPTARNRRKTHCNQGHPLTGDNVYVMKTPNGGTGRKCKICRLEWQRARRAKGIR